MEKVTAVAGDISPIGIVPRTPLGGKSLLLKLMSIPAKSSENSSKQKTVVKKTSNVMTLEINPCEDFLLKLNKAELKMRKQTDVEGAMGM